MFASYFTLFFGYIAMFLYYIIPSFNNKAQSRTKKAPGKTRGSRLKMLNLIGFSPELPQPAARHHGD